MNDPVHNPPHYKSGGIEVIDVIEAFGLNANFRLANVIKYVLRAGRKGDMLQDLEKAAWYLDREIDKLYEQAEADEVDDEVEEDNRKSLDAELRNIWQSPSGTIAKAFDRVAQIDKQEYDG